MPATSSRSANNSRPRSATPSRPTSRPRTTGAPAASYASGTRDGELHALLSHTGWGMLDFAGFAVLSPFVAWGPARATDEDRAAILMAWRERLRSIEHEAPEPPKPLVG